MRQKTGQIFFFTGKFAFFFKNLCFQQPLRCNRINPVTSTVIVKIPCEPSYIVPWGLSHSRMREETGQKLFFTGKFAFFFKNLCFQLLRYNRIKPLTSKASVKTGSGYSQTRPSGLSHSRIREKTGQKLFSIESLPLFQKVVFSTTS